VFTRQPSPVVTGIVGRSRRSGSGEQGHGDDGSGFGHCGLRAPTHEQRTFDERKVRCAGATESVDRAMAMRVSRNSSELDAAKRPAGLIKSGAAPTVVCSTPGSRRGPG
jgi:hypothetical protein